MTLKEIFNNIYEINNLLTTKFISDDNVKELDFLFKNYNKIPNLVLLGQSGAGKSTLINELLGTKLLEATNGKGAVTQFPIELRYSDTPKFTIVPENIDNNDLSEILNDKKYCSSFNDSFLTDNHLLELISEKIVNLNNNDIPYDENSNKYKWKDFYKMINGQLINNKNKYHINYDNCFFNILPFIKKIILYHPSDILKNINLVDLPGLYDKSKIRTDKTNKYLNNETDFIIIVENNNRAITSAFIDKSLTNHIANIISKKRITDILIAITQIDLTYDSIIDDYKEENEYDEDDELNEEELSEVLSEFNERISNTEQTISENIKNKESLKIYNIDSESINIQCCSSKNKINKDLDMNTITKLREYIHNLSTKRGFKYESIISQLLKDYYDNIFDYITQKSLKNDEITKIKNIINEISNTILSEFKHCSQNSCISVCDKNSFTEVIKSNETYKNKLNRYTEGHTLIAVLRKLYHESCHEVIFNMTEDISEPYIKLWNQSYTKLLNNIDGNYNSNKSLIQKDIYTKLYDINSIDSSDIDKLKQSIIIKLVHKDSSTFINDQYVSYENYLQNEGNNIINKIIRKHLIVYRWKAEDISGTGTANECRNLIEELLNYDNSEKIRSEINKELGDLLLDTVNKIKDTFIKEFTKIITNFYSKYNDIKIDINKIKELCNKIDILFDDNEKFEDCM